MKTLLALLCLFAGLAISHAATSWQESLRSMPIPAGTPLLNRDNAVSILLHTFRSNDTVKGLIVLPEVADDFFLINRDKPKLNISATNLLEALVKLTNATALRLAFREPFLLAYMDGDKLEPALFTENADTTRRLKSERSMVHGVFVDTHWDRLNPRLAQDLKLPLRPAADSQDAWHFARHNFAGWNLSGWELLTAVSLTGNTTVTVHKQAIDVRERVKP